MVTMHVREDRGMPSRGVQRYLERKKTRLNLEVSLSPEMVELALSLKPESVCLVPENRKEVTTEGGLDVAGNLERSREVVGAFLEAGIPTSMFIDPDPAQLEASAEIGSPWVELHTSSLPGWFDSENREKKLGTLRSGMELGVSLGLRVNAGHGISAGVRGKTLIKFTSTTSDTALFHVPSPPVWRRPSKPCAGCSTSERTTRHSFEPTP